MRTKHRRDLVFRHAASVEVVMSPLLLAVLGGTSVIAERARLLGHPVVQLELLPGGVAALHGIGRTAVIFHVCHTLFTFSLRIVMTCSVDTGCETCEALGAMNAIVHSSSRATVLVFPVLQCHEDRPTARWIRGNASLYYSCQSASRVVEILEKTTSASISLLSFCVLVNKFLLKGQDAFVVLT